MNQESLLTQLDVITCAPNGDKKLRELILQLAVRGKLVLQHQDDEPARVLLQRIATEKMRLFAQGAIRQPAPLPQVGEQEVPFALPRGWEWKRFADVANIASNLVDPAAYASEPHVAPDSIEKGTGRLLEYRTVGEDAVHSSKHRFYAGQIL